MTEAASRSVFQGRYEILHALRSGGFADVYKARQLATGQLVAIKIMRTTAGRSDADAARLVARFQREMRLCAELHHPNIVRLVDSGRTDDGRLYLVFEFVPGQDLADLLADEGALDPREARHLMLQVLDALGCAHRLGVVHRDLKPANIMIVPTGARRNALVLDFGIGALMPIAAGGACARITATSEIVCTPSYAAPEQVRGMTPTARSDLYAWGLVFLECLTGRPAVTGSSPQQVLLEQVSDAPIAIAAPLADHPLGAILRQATLKDVAGRAVSADRLLHELEACDVSGLRREALAGFESGSRPRPAATEEGAGIAPETIPLDWSVPGDPAASAEQTAARAPGEPDTSAPVIQSEGERRPLTVVCCSLVAAGPGLETVDLEEIDEAFGEEQEVCADIARRHGGVVAGAMGERVFLHFGYPVAQEDDARRAARAALEIGEQVRARSARFAAARGVALDARIGVHTGLVIAREGRGPSPSFGTTTQIAARLSSLAAPGAIVTSGETYQLLRGRFALVADGARSIPGVARPIEVYSLRGETAAPDARREGDTARMVGRSQELDLLLQCWSRTRQGSGQRVLLTGGAGIGKTRLACELVRRLRDETCTCLECRCTEETRRSALRPLIEALERQVEAGCEAGSGRLERMESLLSRRRLDLTEAVPLLAALLEIPLGPRYAPLDLSPQRRKERTFEVLLSLLCETAEEQPVLLVAEDLQWADPLTLEWLGELVEEVPSTRIMALYTARPEVSPPWPTTGMVQIQLGRLDREHVEQMVADLSGGRAIPGPVLAQIVDRTDGVPLFVEELSRMVLESGAIAPRDGRSTPLPQASELAIPATLRGLLTARLDRLGRAKETAQLASALGREFSYDVLEAVSGLDPAGLREDLEKLLGADLVHRRRRVRDPVYFFKHALIREAAYESLPRRARLRVHAHIARTLEERFPETVRTRPGILAYHHAAADQKRQAIAYAERAAELALEGPAGGADDTEAVEHLRNALGWLSALPDDRERALTELRLNSLLILAIMDRRGYMDPALSAAVKRSRELSDALGDSPLTAPTLFAMFEYHNVRSHRVEARALAERLVRMADELHDDGQAVWALPLLGQCLLYEGRLTEARAHLERALLLYDPVAHRDQAFAYGVDSRVYAGTTLSLVLALLGHPDRALFEGEAAVTWARELDHPNSLGVALLYLAGVYHYGGRRDKVAEVSSALTALTDRYRLWLKDYGWLFRRWAEGDLEQLARHLAALRPSEQRAGMTYWMSLEAELMTERGHHEAALARIDDCLRLATETGETYWVPELERRKAISLDAWDARATPESDACLRLAVAVARQQGARMPELRSTIALCRSLRTQGRQGEARELLEGAFGWPAEHAAMPELEEARDLWRALSG